MREVGDQTPGHGFGKLDRLEGLIQPFEGLELDHQFGWFHEGTQYL